MPKAALIAGVLAFAVSAPCIFNDFVMEEKNTTIVDNHEIRSLSNILGFFAGSWTSRGLGSNYYRPIPASLLAIQYALFGLEPAGWHLVSSLIYSIGTFLVALLIARVTRSNTAALVGGALFAVLPAHVEPFAAVNYQTVLLMGLFAASALLAFGRVMERGLSAKSLALFALFTAASMMSKEEGYAVPVLALSWALLERPAGRLRSALLCVASIAPVAAFLLYLRGLSVQPIEQTFFVNSPAGEVATTMLRVVVLYAEILIFPIRLCQFYDWFIIPYESTFSFNAALGSVILIAIAFSIYTAARKGANDVAVGLSWLLLGMIPVSQIIPFVVVAADRFLYLPSIGWCAALGALAARLFSTLAGTRRSIAISAVAIALAAYGARTIYRTGDWKDDYALNRAAALDFPQNPVPHVNLANLYLSEGELESAKRSIDEAIRLSPKWKIPRKVDARIEEARSKKRADAQDRLNPSK